MCHPCKTLLLQYWSLWHCVCHVDHILNEVHINYVKLYDRDRDECILEPRLQQKYVSMDAPFFQLLYNEIMSVCLPREKVLVVILQQLITHIHTYAQLVRMCVRTCRTCIH